MNGLLVVDKPKDYTSFDVVAVMRKITGERKIGHTGTLDPMATGVLPLLMGRAAKAADLLPDTNKTYQAEFRFGIKTDTGDITGVIQEKSDKFISLEELKAVLSCFRGEIQQIPPMYSAVSVGGTRLYTLARKGIEVEREPRTIQISELELVSYQSENKVGVLKIECSKGTYIRTLIEDIAQKLDTVGVMTALRRTHACGFSLEESLTLDEVRNLSQRGELSSHIKVVDQLFAHEEKIVVSEAQAVRFQNGGALSLDRLKNISRSQNQILRVYSPENLFLGLGKINLLKKELEIVKLFAVKGE